MFFLPVALTMAGALALVNFWLALRVVQLRIREKVLNGDGGNARVAARMRAHANFIEYAPLTLVLLALIELAKGTQFWLWVAAALFVIGRVLHGIGMDGWRPGRAGGILITWAVMLGLAGYATYLGYSGLNPLR